MDETCLLDTGMNLTYIRYHIKAPLAQEEPFRLIHHPAFEDSAGFSLHKAASLFCSMETHQSFHLSSKLPSRHLVLAAGLLQEWLCVAMLPVFNNEYKMAEAWPFHGVPPTHL